MIGFFVEIFIKNGSSVESIRDVNWGISSKFYDRKFETTFTVEILDQRSMHKTFFLNSNFKKNMPMP